MYKLTQFLINFFMPIFIIKIRITKKCRIKNISISGNVNFGNKNIIRKCKLEGNIKIGDYVRLQEVSLSGKISIGSYTSISGPCTDIYAAVNDVSIGKFCSIARNVSIQEYDHKISRITSYYIAKHIFGKKISNDIISKGSIKIGNDVWIGAQCVITSGVTIGDGAIIGANSVVTKDIPPYSIAVGSPARIIRYRFNKNIIVALLKIEWWNRPIVQIEKCKPLFLKENISETDIAELKEILETTEVI